MAVLAFGEGGDVVVPRVEGDKVNLAIGSYAKAKLSASDAREFSETLAKMADAIDDIHGTEA